jgi:hypothetical protein
MIFPAAWGYGSEKAAAALPIPTDKVRKDRGGVYSTCTRVNHSLIEISKPHWPMRIMRLRPRILVSMKQKQPTIPAEATASVIQVEARELLCPLRVKLETSAQDLTTRRGKN